MPILHDYQRRRSSLLLNGRPTWEYHTTGLVLETYGFDRIFQLRKSRKEGECRMCDRKIVKGVYRAGNTWFPVCLSCYEQYVDNSVNTVDKLKEKILAYKQYYKENEDKIREHNLVRCI